MKQFVLVNTFINIFAFRTREVFDEFENLMEVTLNEVISLIKMSKKLILKKVIGSKALLTS